MSSESWMMLASLLLGLCAATGSTLLIQFVDWVNDRFTHDIRTRAEQLGLSAQRDLLWLRWWWMLVIVTLLMVGVVLQMPPVAALLGLLLVISPRNILAWQAERRRIRLRDQMVSAARSLASQFRAGLPLVDGLSSVAREARPPMSHELRRCVDEYAAGSTLQESLTTFKNRLDIDAITLFVVALLACERRGGRVTDAMDNISRSLEELQRVERKRESVTAGGRTLVLVLSLFPPLFAGLFYLIDPDSLSLLFGTLLGQLVICGIIVLTYVSVKWAYWLIAAIE